MAALCDRDCTSFPCFSRFLVSRLLLALLLPSCVHRLTSRSYRYRWPLHCLSDGLTELREPASGPVSPVLTACRFPHSRPPPAPGTHALALRPSSLPLRVPLPVPPESFLPEVPDPKSDHAQAASPTVSRLLATAVTKPSFESAAMSALVAELLDFGAACGLDYASALVAESAFASHPSVRGECALGTDVLVDRVKRSPCSLPAFKAHYVARGFCQRQMHSFLRGQPARGDLAAPPTWLHWVVSCKYLVEPPGASLRSPPGASRVARHTEDCTCGSWDCSFYCLPVAVLQRFGFQFSSPQPTSLSTSHSLSAPPSDESVEPNGLYLDLVGCLWYLMTFTRPDLAYPLSLVARYVAHGRHQKVHWDAAKRVLSYLCSTSGTGLVLGGRGPAVLTGHVDASWVDKSATQWSSQGYTFSLGSSSVSWRSTRSSSVLSSSCEAEIYAGAMAA
ncbi:unnamed protein product [Closterium sp. NIES-53]